EREHLVELGGHDDHGRAVVALRHDALVHELDGAHVEAACRLRRDEQAQRPRHLPREHDLLLVAARERARGDLHVLRAHVELHDALLRVVADRALVERSAARVGHAVEQVEHEVLLHGERATMPSVLRSSGTYPTPAARTSATPRPTSSVSSSVIDPATGLRRPTIVSVSSVCPLPCTPATTRISPRATSRLTRST